MGEKIIELEKYKNALLIKKGLDEGTTSIDNLLLDDLENVNELYESEITGMKKRIKELDEENRILRMFLDE